MMLPNRFTYPSPGFSHYWNEGGGKKMLRQLGRVPAKDEVELHAELLLEADGLADKVVKEVFEAMGFQKAHLMIEEALNSGIGSVKDAPECLKELFRAAETLPVWLDADLLNAGSEFCRRTGSFGLTVLRNYCLMGGYES